MTSMIETAQRQLSQQHAALGMVLLNAFTTLAGWRYSFVFHIPLAVVVLLVATLFVPMEWSADEQGDFDVKGAVIYSLTIIMLCVGVSSLPGLSSYILIAAGIFGMVLFFYLARNTKHPIFDVRLPYTNRVFTMSSLASLILYTATFANVVLIGLYLQYINGMSASAAGFFMMIQPLTMTVVSPFAGRLSDHVEPRVIASLGMLITMVGLVLLALLSSINSTHYLVIGLITTGAGFALFSPPNTSAIMGSMDKQSYGSASGSIATMRTLGQMNSIVLVTLVFALIIGHVEIRPHNYADLQTAITLCFSLAPILCLPGLVLSIARGNVRL